MRPRVRTIKPELFQNEELADLEWDTGLPIRLTYIGLLLLADREGRFEWKPGLIAAMLFPYHRLEVGEVLESLRFYDFVRRYNVDGKSYGYIPTFARHQSVNHREKQSTLPAPTEENTEDPEVPDIAPSGGQLDGEKADEEPPLALALEPPVIGTIGPRSQNLVEERVGQVRDATERKKQREAQLGTFIEVVFLYWRERMGRTGRTVLDRKRKTRIKARLLENDGDVNELLCTVDGALKDDFLMGREERSGGKKHDGIETIFRDRGQVERLAPLSLHYGKPVHPFMQAKGADE